MTEIYALEGQAGDRADPRPGVPSPGLGQYASYHSLWHLHEIGVVTDLRTFESPAWDDAAKAQAGTNKRPTRVALIDVSVAYKHPNLEQAVRSDLMIDFFSSRWGTFPSPGQSGAALVEALSNATEKARISSNARVLDLFKEMCSRLQREHDDAREQDWRAPLRVAPATNPAFSAHGTAMAGLIGARPRGPEDARFVSTGHIMNGEEKERPIFAERTGLPYAGVDPFCNIIPISTSFDPDPEQLILTLLYAWLIDADVIVLARDFADPLRTMISRPGLDPERQFDGYPIKFGSAELELWDALKQLTLDLSRNIVIVCAAGNGVDDPLMYPASLARDDNGIVAVGARAATGQRAAYSSLAGPDDPADITIYAPSGDGDRLDNEIQRLDTADANFRSSDHSALYVANLGVQYPALQTGVTQPTSQSTFATQEIISTDVPGPAGYNSSEFGRPATEAGGILDYRSYYCHFSGTSAACAIVAGALSLAISAEKIPSRDPVSVKRRLRGGVQITDDGAGLPYLSWNTLAQF